jgi:hypothetical protein
MSTPTSKRLSRRIAEFSEGLSELERFNLNLIMSIGVGGIAPRGDVPESGARKDAWDTGISVLSATGRSGVSFVGRAPFMTDDLLSGLQREAVERKSISHRTGPQELSPGGSAAEALSRNPDAISLISDSLGEKVFPTEISTYLYYTSGGDYLYPHVDTDIFSVNLITMLERRVPEGKREEDASALVVYDADANPRRVPLRVGESAVLMASGTVHARETLAPGEKVTILTVGFQYQGLKPSDFGQ